MHKTLLIVAILVTSVSAVRAQELWQGLLVGDSKQEVLQKLPLASFEDGTDIGQVADQKLFGEEFTVNLYLQDARLEQVILIRRAMDKSGASRTFESLSKALKLKYGKPVDIENPRDAVIFQKPFWIKWRKNGTDIMLVDQFKDKAVMLNYRSSPPDAALKALPNPGANDIKREAGKL
jgi:hypothetical protein